MCVALKKLSNERSGRRQWNAYFTLYIVGSRSLIPENSVEGFVSLNFLVTESSRNPPHRAEVEFKKYLDELIFFLSFLQKSWTRNIGKDSDLWTQEPNPNRNL